MIDPAVHLCLRFAFALLFASAAYHKATDFESFRLILRDYELLPRRALAAASVAIVLAEVSLASSLALGVRERVAALSLVVLLGCYAGAITVNLLRGRRDIGCGCSGAMHKQLISWWLVARNLVLMAAATVLFVPVGARPVEALDAFTVAAAVSAFGVLYAAANRLVSQWPAHLRVRQALSGGEAA